MLRLLESFPGFNLMRRMIDNFDVLTILNRSMKPSHRSFFQIFSQTGYFIFFLIKRKFLEN